MDGGDVLPVLVGSQVGYRNLCRLVTRAKLRSPKNEHAVQWDELREFGEGLVCLTGDEEGPLRRAIQADDRETAEGTLIRLKEIFGKDRVFVELQRHHLRGEEREIRAQVALAERFGLPIVASNGVQYATSDRRGLQDVFTCLRNHTRLDEAGRLLALNSERHLKSAAGMMELFRDLPEAVSNTVRVAEQLDFTLANLGYRFPDYPLKPDEDVDGKLRYEAYEGAKRRYGGITEKVRKQLDHELALISKLGFGGYFLIVWDIVNFCRSEGILVQGRGSAANSAVCYSLGITAVDPIGSKLLFERFLSEGRSSWPDIDLDLPSGDQREKVIQEVYRRFAPNGAAMTANVITYRGRSAMREMGKALGLPDQFLGRFSELYASGDFPHTLELMNQIEQAGLSGDHPRLPALLSLYRQAYGLPRHLGQHCGGMVVCNHGLDSVVPLEPATMPGRVIMQWDKDNCEDLGIIKIDLLGLGMMAVVEECLEVSCSRGADRHVEFHKIPQEDPATFEMIRAADTIGMFQIESRAQMATIPRMQPKIFYDLAIEVAIIRPGPIAGNLTHPYLDRRQGIKPITYMHPDLKPVLERTLGVPLFQEQVLQIAMIMADFTGSEAEELRRAMSFHRSEERMNRVVDKLRKALDEKGVRPEVQDEIVNSIRSFALYGFPESHAISFAGIAYVSAWLKCHRSAEFYSALLNNQPMGFYSSDTLIKDARRHGIRVLPVHVGLSDWKCLVVDDRTIRLGFSSLKGLSHVSAERILTEREARDWANLEDFLLRSRLPKDERRALAEVGALNELAGHRRDALWKVEKLVDPEDLFFQSEVRAAGRDSSGGDEEGATVSQVLPSMDPVERLDADYRRMHLTTGPHPMAYLRKAMTDIVMAEDLVYEGDDRWVKIAGMVICRQRPGTAKGHMFISLEDESGISNAFVPSGTFEKNRLVITQEQFLIIEGRLQNQRGVVTVLAKKIHPMGSILPKVGLSHDFH